MINTEEITEFPNHPFRIEDNEEMDKMIQSVKNIGVREPVIVKKKSKRRI